MLFSDLFATPCPALLPIPHSGGLNLNSYTFLSPSAPSRAPSRSPHSDRGNWSFQGSLSPSPSSISILAPSLRPHSPSLLATNQTLFLCSKSVDNTPTYIFPCPSIATFLYIFSILILNFLIVQWNDLSCNTKSTFINSVTLEKILIISVIRYPYMLTGNNSNSPFIKSLLWG